MPKEAFIVSRKSRYVHGVSSIRKRLTNTSKQHRQGKMHSESGRGESTEPRGIIHSKETSGGVAADMKTNEAPPIEYATLHNGGTKSESRGSA